MALLTVNAAAFTADELDAVRQSLHRAIKVGICLWHFFETFIEKAL